MALTAAGNLLTDAHRAQQLAVRAGSISGLMRMWSVVDPVNLGDTINVFAQAAAILAGQGFDQSATAAAQYYSLFRRVELGSGLAVPAASRPGVEFLAGQLRGAALKGIIDARRAGKSVAGAKDQGLIRVVGTLTKLVLAGGRQTVTGGVQVDRKALGWGRVTSGDPCTFCRTLASRGPVYKSERSADFEAHDHDGCSAEPLFGDDPLESSKVIRQSEEYLTEYRTAQEWARASGTMSTKTSNNALNNYRRWLDNGSPEPGVTTAVTPATTPEGGSPNG